MEANNFRLQEKTYKKCMMHSIIDLYTVFPVSAVLNGHELPVKVEEVQLKIKKQTLLAVFP